MDECQLICYPRSGTCSLRRGVCCVLLTFFPFKYFIQIPFLPPKLKVKLPLNSWHFTVPGENKVAPLSINGVLYSVMYVMYMYLDSEQVYHMSNHQEEI